MLGHRVKCPGCAEPFTANPSAPPPATEKGERAKQKGGAIDGEDIEVVDDDGGEDADDRRRSRRHREEEEDDRPARAGRRSRVEDDDEEDRPRKKKKKKRRRAEGDGPWLVAIGVTGVFLVIAFFISIVANGTMGMEPAKDGPLVKCLALGIGLVVALAMAGLGVNAVRKREIWTGNAFSGFMLTGTAAVVLGMFQAAVGGCLCGWLVYGLFFTVLRGR
jgi:hypothetical protein